MGNRFAPLLLMARKASVIARPLTSLRPAFISSRSILSNMIFDAAGKRLLGHLERLAFDFKLEGVLRRGAADALEQWRCGLALRAQAPCLLQVPPPPAPEHP